MFEQGLRQMPDGTRGRCQGRLSKVMTPQPLEVASLLKLAATNVLFPRRSKEAFVVR